MRKRDELSNPESCLNKAHDDEMLFIFLGRDRAAAAGVQTWIDKRIELGLNHPDDAKIVSARQWIETVLEEQSHA
jgi:hypothetical protein